MKKLICVLLTLVMVIGVMSVNVFAEDITITVRTPIKNDTSEVFTVSSSMTVGDLKASIANKLNISFADSEGYYLYSNTKLRDDSKTLADYKITDGATVYLEKLVWTLTEDHPFEFYGLEIYGGTATNEPGTISDNVTVEFDYNFSTKVIRIKNSATAKTNIYVTGTSDCVMINSSTSNWATLTLKNANLSRNDITADSGNNSGVIVVNASRRLNINLEGNNYISNTSAKTPAIVTNNSESQLRIKSGTNGSLTVTSTGNNIPAIGTRSTTDWLRGIEIEGGNITANGGAGAPAIRTNYLKISGGSLAANPGTGCDTAIEVYESGKTSKVTEGLFQTTPSAGSITLCGCVSATEIRNTSKLTFSSYDSLPDGSVYRHDLTRGTVYVGEDEYVWDSEQNKWIKKCIHIVSEILYIGEGEYAPTCENNGLGHTECTICGKVISSGITVPATGHNFIVIDAGNGYHMTICQNGCGIAVTSEHTYIDSKCTVCGNKENYAEVSDEEEIIETDIPVESAVEESDIEQEEVPETGIVFSLSVLALYAAAVAVTKR